MTRGQIILIVIFITFVIGVLNFKKFRASTLKYFVFFIGYVLISEIIANSLSVQKISTVVVNNSYFVGSNLFYLFFYSRILTKLKYKKLAYIFAGVFVLSVFMNTIFFQTFINAIQTYSLILGMLFVSILIILFFSEIMNSDKILVLKKLTIFWISIGVLLFNLGIIPVLVVGELIQWSGIFDYILLLLNVLMYGCFIIGFLITKKKSDL